MLKWVKKEGCRMKWRGMVPREGKRGFLEGRVEVNTFLTKKTLKLKKKKKSIEPIPWSFNVRCARP